jgi:hypothetical protein
MILRAASNVYRDLQLAKAFSPPNEDYVSTIRSKPGVLSLDISRGQRPMLDEGERALLVIWIFRRYGRGSARRGGQVRREGGTLAWWVNYKRG